MRKGFNNEVQVKIDLMGLLGKGGEGDSPTGKSLPFSYSFPSAVAARGVEVASSGQWLFH